MLLEGDFHGLPHRVDLQSAKPFARATELEHVAFDQTHDVVKSHILRGSSEGVASLFTAFARNEASIAQFGEDLHEIVGRDLLHFRQVLDVR